LPEPGQSPPTRSAIPPQLVLFAAFVATSILNYAFGLAASRILGPGDFGLLASAQAVLLLAALVLQSGIPWSLTRSIAGIVPGDRPALVRGSLVANLGVAGLVAGVLAVLFAAGPLRAALEEPAILLVVIVTLPLFATISVARAAAQGWRRFGLIAALQVAEVTTKTVAGLALAAAGFGAVGAIAGFTAGGVVAAALGIGVLAMLGVRAAGGRLRPAASDLAPMFGTLLGLALLLNVDLLAVKSLVGDRAIAGHYQAAIILANAPYFLATSALIPPLYAAAASHTHLSFSRPLLGRALATATVLILPFELLLIAVPEAVLAILFPPEYADAAPILRVMAVGNGFLMLAALVSATFQAVGRAAVPARIFLVLAAIEVPVLLLVVPAGGGQAAVITFASVSALALAALGAAYLRVVPVDARRVLGWCTRLLAAVAAGLAVALGIRVFAGVVPAMAAAGVVYLGAAAAMRILPRLRLAGQTA
jgi:O-antigen/teichoic acid export membrane protein